MPGARGAVTALVASLLAGCSLLVDLDPGVRDPSADGDGGPGDGDDDGGADLDADAGPCGSVGRLQDTFAPGQLASHWVPRALGDEAGEPAVTGSGRLSVGFATAPSTDDQFSEVESRFAYDLRGHAVTAWTDVTDDRSWSTIEVREAARFDGDRRILALGRKGTVFAAFIRSPSVQVLRQEVFSHGEHRVWRIREVAGALEFEVAGLDREFTPFTTLELPGLDLGSVMVGIAVNADVTPVTVGPGFFDDLNTDDTADPACRVDTLRDRFADGDLGPLWIDNSDGCSVTTGDGVLLTAASSATCVLDSAHAYSIADGGELVVEVAAFPTDPGARTELRLVHDDENYLAVQQEDGQLHIILVVNGTGDAPITLANAVGAQWWRVRERDGQLEVATGGDPGSFSPRDTLLSRDLDLSELRVSLQLRVGAADSAQVAGVNILP